MEFEDGLILGVGVLIAANQLFLNSGLRNSRPAYVFVQAFNVGAVVALFFAHVNPDPRLDYAVRGFLMLFVAFHMTKNSAIRSSVRKPTADEEDELQRMRREIEEEIAAERAAEDAPHPR